MKKVLAFDLDGTLAASKSPMTDTMAALLDNLLDHFHICVISGGKFAQFEKQMLASLKAEPIKLEKFGESVDISFKGTTDYNDKWENVLINRAKLIGAKDHIDLVVNPKYYYYFMGFKFVRFKYDLIIRYNRSRPAQLTDLLVIRQMFGLNYKISIPTQTRQYNKDLQKDEYIDVIIPNDNVIANPLIGPLAIENKVQRLKFNLAAGHISDEKNILWINSKHDFA